MGSHVNYGGLVIAGIGFFLTRFTVTLALYEDPLRFYLAGVVPLTLGLGLAAFGVALAVADVERSLVRTTALWCVAGAGTMLLLVLLTLLGSTTGDVPDLATVRSQAYLSNFLIGGSVGGTLTGLYASRNRRQRRELARQANRLAILNALLRDEILNAVTAIRGYATARSVDPAEAEQVIEKHSDSIAETVEEVKYLTQRSRRGTSSGVPIELADCLTESVSTVTEQYPNADVSVGPVPNGLTVRANDHLALVFAHLLENAIVHAADTSPAVTVATTGTDVSVTVADEGSGLSGEQRAILESGTVETFSDPSSGLGLNLVRLFVESYDGRIDAEVGDSGTSVTVVLPRASTADAELRPNRHDLGGIRPAIPHLVVTVVAAVIAGVCYGAVSEVLGGSIAGIGVFYGTANDVVGWMTHEFHSVVFGFVFVSLVSMAPDRYHDSLLPYVAIGVGWAVVLWLVAASVVAPVWLRLLGTPAAVPSFSARLLASHLVWGISLGAFTAWGYEHVTPLLTRRDESPASGSMRT